MLDSKVSKGHHPQGSGLGGALQAWRFAAWAMLRSIQAAMRSRALPDLNVVFVAQAAMELRRDTNECCVRLALL